MGIELFFKALKQNLKIRTFVGTSEKALLIQIWTASSAMLPIKDLLSKSKSGRSFSNLVVFPRRDRSGCHHLWERIDRASDTVLITPMLVQQRLMLPALGQQWSDPRRDDTAAIGRDVNKH